VKSSRVASIEVDDNNVDALVSSTTSLTLSGGHSSGNIIGPPGGRVGFDGSISRHSPSPPPSDGESFSDDVEEEDIDEYDENLAASANLSDLEEGRMTTNIKHKKKKEKERDSSTSDLKTKSKKKKKHKKRSELNSTEKGESKEVKGKKSGKKKKKHSKVKKQDDNGGDDEDPEGLMVEGKNSGRICYCLPPYCTRWTILASTVFFLVVAAAVAVPCYFFLWPNDDNAAPADNFPRIGDVSPETVLSEIPVTICNDWVPGSMSSSGECTNEITLEHGGLLCNLAAKSMLNTTVIADLALINAGTCRSDLSPPRVTAAEILDAIDADQIVVLDIAGADLEKLIFQAAEVSFGGLGGPERYPYASGMRWHMEANLPAYERVKMIEINRRLEGEWVPIDPGRFYRVATTKFLSQGGLEYLAFGKVLDEWKQEFEFQTIDTFYNFISTQPSSWWDLPQSEYSTQYFVAEDEVTEIAAVPARICSANVPGQPNSESCSASDVANGSGVCNLLAWAIYDQAADYDFDFVLVTADACGDDIPDDEVFGLESVYSAVDGNSILVTMDVPGHIIKIMIENSVGTALSFRPVSYPYAAGLRFSVDSTQDVGSWVSNIEFFDRDSGWRAFDPSLTYTVLTLEDVAIARDDAFFAIANADTSSIRDVSQGTQDFFLSYAEDWKELQTPPPEKASTQLFIA
jgi:2',3'-cyclic-nucleotide 2'-phosphodiesterase (5'-nucleotidase family)